MDMNNGSEWSFPKNRQDGEVEQKEKRPFCKFTNRSRDPDQLLDKFYEGLRQLYSARKRWRLNLGLRRKWPLLLRRLRKAKKEAQPTEKPEVMSHLRDLIILPEMVGVYNGKTFNQVEIKPRMTGHHLSEFSNTNNPVKDGRPSTGATDSSRLVPLR
ncbi:40S ribosomal protein S15-like [Phyllostomus hastatus]|uniref:40S ribosomal protein S15-like n=1 Tax=Phyllostomus hastatus TaxID=9423 RepID=UPI001E683C50|nr:40S ribosomal protein S15-like [Phyllostomus hastatus]